MWKSVVGHDVSVSVETQGDDWDTDPDFVNDISEKEQRWGAKTIEGSGRTEHIKIDEPWSCGFFQHPPAEEQSIRGA
ncbi:HCLS1 isoform 8 [Pan troglodytes]|uniref:Hematopoietic cell-specific Lyn substrate 1 n=2 Tax=Homininae TaxID=207598 RepID=F8WEZ6_HUMAN|nr:hematopoietic cell-specific Lyn substrate 1 [Homo sapiens]KAI4031154.1 hematopoietic cell-specific Lyn substrate 1 [Homo sapiens]PNI54131.1 HCLS1 isoform 8 [Pan troglodytes]